MQHSSRPGAKASFTCKGGAGLQRLAQAHVVSQHPMQAAGVQEGEPVDAGTLVGPQLPSYSHRQAVLLRLQGTAKTVDPILKHMLCTRPDEARSAQSEHAMDIAPFMSHPVGAVLAQTSAWATTAWALPWCCL